jgi:hypothetical protein
MGVLTDASVMVQHSIKFMKKVSPFGAELFVLFPFQFDVWRVFPDIPQGAPLVL